MQDMRFGLDQRPGAGPMLLYGLQWLVISLPSAVIVGLIVARMHFPADAAMQIAYIQKLFGLIGAATVAQVLWGHKLPVVVGPATVLLVGITASSSSGISALYTAMLVGGGFLVFLALSGLLARVRCFFTPRIVSTILILIAVTLAPTILRLISSSGAQGFAAPLDSIVAAFAMLLAVGLFIVNKVLPGVWKSLTVLIGLVGGSSAYFLFAGLPVLPSTGVSAGPFPFFIDFAFDSGTLLAFLFCYLALLINELGSVESVARMLNTADTGKRINRGVGVQGLANMAAGSMGVIGSVDYSLSTGVISATGCASRHTLVPAGAGLVLCAFSPDLLRIFTLIPAVVMGALMLYLMAAQLASGLIMLVTQRAISDFSEGVTVGFPIMLSLLIAFAPDGIIAGVPDLLRPILGNGFVMGAIAVFFLEHCLCTGKK